MSEVAAPKRRRGATGTIVALVVLALVAGGAVFGGKALLRTFSGPAPDFDGPGTGTVNVQVRKGETAADIGETLERNGVVRSARAFRDAARKDDRSTRIQPGWYRLRSRMKASLALDLLLDPKARLRSRVTIPEGTTLERTLQLIAANVSDVPLASLKEAAANPAALGLPAYANGKLEGFLFPATYDVEPGTSAVEVLRMLVSEFEERAEALDLEGRAAALHVTPYQALIIASLVEGETGQASDRGKVSRVVYNRRAKGMRLQFDSTVKYAYGLRGVVKQRLFNRDLEIDSPYNTYRVAGLPPAPINSPGEAALEAALAPEAGPWLYFVVIDKQGHSAFATTGEEFARLKERYRKDVLGQ
ncbi:MAG TPA: endolytic transglycosylase MltG [Mycobacteriales bacterium]|nr:endolytic transglycosylase MltG [Mycobacteriales bacterium]